MLQVLPPGQNVLFSFSKSVLKPCGIAENDFILEWMLDHYNTVIGFGQFQQDKYQLRWTAILQFYPRYLINTHSFINVEF